MQGRVYNDRSIESYLYVKRWFQHTPKAFLLLFCSLCSFCAFAEVFSQNISSASADYSANKNKRNLSERSRNFILNGHRLVGTLTSSQDSPQELVDALSQRWTQRKVMYDKNVGSSGMQEQQRNQMGLSRPLVSLGENWGMFANLNLLAGFREGASKVLSDKYIFFASQLDSTAQTDVWRFDIPTETLPLKLFTPEFSNHAGNLGVQKYPGSVVKWSVIETSSERQNELYVLESKGMVGQHISHYSNACKREGYRLDRTQLVEDNRAHLLCSKSGITLELVIQRRLKSMGIVENVIQLHKNVS